MRRTGYRLIAAFVFGLLLLFAAAAYAAVDCRSEGALWSHTTPAVNLRHIFCGERNRRGEPVGYHALAGARGPGEARIAQVLDGPDERGIYRARVCLSGRRPACKWSTMFPDTLTHDEVLEAILAAYHAGTVDDRGRWCGPSGLGFDIEGWLLPDRERINTAWPARHGCSARPGPG